MMNIIIIINRLKAAPLQHNTIPLSKQILGLQRMMSSSSSLSLSYSSDLIALRAALSPSFSSVSYNGGHGNSLSFSLTSNGLLDFLLLLYLELMPLIGAGAVS